MNKRNKIQQCFLIIILSIALLIGIGAQIDVWMNRERSIFTVTEITTNGVITEDQKHTLYFISKQELTKFIQWNQIEEKTQFEIDYNGILESYPALLCKIYQIRIVQ